jgi:hypothetical protein
MEGSFERRQREAANRAGQKAADDANDEYQRQQEALALAGGHGGELANAYWRDNSESRG